MWFKLDFLDPFYTVKRPIISTATKIVNKEERIPRIPVPKRDPIPTTISRAPRNAASIRASDAKSNPVAQRVNQVAQRGNRCRIAR